MPAKRSKPCDYHRLREALENHGTNIQQASAKLGHAESYLYKVDAAGRLNEVEIVGLKALFGIEYDEIKPLPKPKPEPKPEPAEKPAAVFSIYDKIALDKLTEAINRQATMDNAQTQAILALTESVKRIADKIDKIDAVLSDPQALYKAVFIPVYSAVKCADSERAEQAKNDVPRRLDGSIDYSKIGRRA